MHWLSKYAGRASHTDNLLKLKLPEARYVALLAAGLYGEAGSLLAEFKKHKREGASSYPLAHHARVSEEIGDCLWYFVRLVSVIKPGLLDRCQERSELQYAEDEGLTLALKFGSKVGALLTELEGGLDSATRNRVTDALAEIWSVLVELAKHKEVWLAKAAAKNLQKLESRWPAALETRGPQAEDYPDLYDESFPEIERFPRKLTFEFVELADKNKRGQEVVLIRYQGLNFADRLTDNIGEDDGYRFHDVFHFAHVVFLGWSPVFRGFLRCKRKSQTEVDRNQDGGRAQVVEEAVSAIVFSRAKQLNYFKGIDQVDYDLLKSIQEFVRGYEVSKASLWQWEQAILRGYDVFRELWANHGGFVELDLEARTLNYYRAPSQDTL